MGRLMEVNIKTGEIDTSERTFSSFQRRIMLDYGHKSGCGLKNVAGKH